MTLAELEEELTDVGEPSFRAKQIFHWLYRKKIYNIDLMFNLAKSLREKLKKDFCITLPFINKVSFSEADGSYKFLLQTHDQRFIETVLMSHGDRTTICVSCMVGCPMGCEFCATGSEMKYIRKLDFSEIIGQIIVAEQYAIRQKIADKITNIVFMGMGEPLLNIENIDKALGIIMGENGFSLPRTKISLSTSGIVDGLSEFFNKHKIRIAVSLHFVDDEMRSKFMPVNKKYNLEQLINELKKIEFGKKDYVTIEYLMIKGLNDSLDNAKKLVRLLSNLKVKINLVPLNPTKNFPYEASDEEQLNEWVKLLWGKGFVTTVRRSKGREVGGACGQLAASKS